MAKSKIEIELEKSEKHTKKLREKFETEKALEEIQKLLVKMKLTKDEIELVKGLLADLRK